MPRPVDDLVYAHADGLTYVACFEGAEGWVRWPAVEDGWRARTHGTEAMADDCEELPPRLARLALQLSGVPDERPWVEGGEREA